MRSEFGNWKKQRVRGSAWREARQKWAKREGGDQQVKTEVSDRSGKFGWGRKINKQTMSLWRRKRQQRTRPGSQDFPSQEEPCKSRNLLSHSPGGGGGSGRRETCRCRGKGGEWWGWRDCRPDLYFLLRAGERQCAESELQRWRAGDFGATGWRRVLCRTGQTPVWAHEHDCQAVPRRVRGCGRPGGSAPGCSPAPKVRVKVRRGESAGQGLRDRTVG